MEFPFCRFLPCSNMHANGADASSMNEVLDVYKQVNRRLVERGFLMPCHFTISLRDSTACRGSRRRFSKRACCGVNETIKQGRTCI